MKKLIALLIVCIAGISAATAQTDAYRAEVEKMIECTGTVSQLSEILETTLAPTLSPYLDKAQLSMLCNELAVALKPDMENATYKACKEIYTLEDMKNINAFYATPTGRKMARNIAKLNNIITESMQSQECQEKVMEIMLKYMR